MALSSIARIFEVVGAFLACESIERVANCGADRVDGSGGSFAEQVP
jgi:hypothetical protein